MWANKIFVPSVLLIFGLFFDSSYGHGRLLEPPNRSSLWRYNNVAAKNYDDDANYCGGAYAQWTFFDGKCGLCGDQYDSPHPQANENTGKYGQGIIAGEYTAGSIVPIEVELTTNHKGFFLFSLAVLENANAVESGEESFLPLTLGDGSSRYNVLPEQKRISTTVKLPEGLTCERCVLRWQYTAGNNWGTCEDGTSGMGCGPQETFRNCADITIS